MDMQYGTNHCNAVNSGTIKEGEPTRFAVSNGHSSSPSDAGQRWILYRRQGTQPLIGSVYAATREEALEWAAANGAPGAIAIPFQEPYPPEAPEKLDRKFRLFGTIIAASTADYDRPRTSYFYRQSAIAWARMGREVWPTESFPPLCRRMAKSYLAAYRKMKSGAA